MEKKRSVHPWTPELEDELNTEKQNIIESDVSENEKLETLRSVFEKKTGLKLTDQEWSKMISG